jgi:hypothetical protein
VAWLCDVRFAIHNDREVHGFALAAGLDPADVKRTVLDERLFGLRPYSLITIKA